MKINVFGDIPGLLCLARSSKWAIPTLAVAGLVLLSASPSLAQPQQPPQAEEKPELKTYALKSNGAKKHVVALEAIYKPSASLKIIAIDDKQIMVYATPKIQTEIRERLKGDLLSDQQKKAIDQQKKAIDALDALVKQMREGKKETPPNLEESLAKALKQNPDLLVSAAKVHEAEAELNRVRLSGVAKLAIALVDYERTDAILDESTRKLDRLTQLRQQKGTSVVTDEELGAARATVEKYKAQKAQNKAALNQDALKADLAVAEAKVHLAQAELNVVRQRILGKIAVIYSELEADRAVLKEMETKLERVKAIYSKGAASITEFADTQLAVDDYKAKLAKKEAELQYLIGKDPPADSPPPYTWPLTPYPASLYSTASTNKVTGLGTTSSTSPNTAKPAAIKVPNGDKLREALAASIPVNKFEMRYDEKLNLKDGLYLLQVHLVKQQIEGVNLLPSATGKVAETIIPGGLYLPNPITLAAVLQMIEDTTTIRFVIRDYGIVAMEAKNIPPGAILVSVFMKHSQDKETKKAPK